jgi:lysyl-tRNA synthetase class 1
LQPPPKEEPFQLSYRHASFLAQISPEEERLEWCLRRMRDTGLLDRDLNEWEEARVGRRLEESRAWVEMYVPENKVVLLEALTPEVERGLEDRDRVALRAYLERAAKVEWTEEAIKESMVSLTKVGRLPVDTSRFFRDLYLVLLGKERGPRAAPFLAVLEKEWVLRRLREATQ